MITVMKRVALDLSKKLITKAGGRTPQYYSISTLKRIRRAVEILKNYVSIIIEFFEKRDPPRKVEWALPDYIQLGETAYMYKLI